jgi:hypothetical protein
MLHKHQRLKKFGYRSFVYGLIGLLLVLMTLAGCGKEDSSDSKSGVSAAPLHACELLTQADVEAILGGPVEEPSQTFKENEKQAFWMSTCNYFAPATSKRAGILIQKSVNVDPVKAFQDHTASLQSTLGEDYSLKAIDGVGVRAGWDGSVSQLTVFEGPRMLIVSTGGPGVDEESALLIAKRIAAKVLSNLPEGK